MLSRLFATVALVALGVAPASADHRDDHKLDAALRQRAHAPRGSSRVIVQTAGGSAADLANGARLVESLGGTPGRRLSALRAVTAEVPDAALDLLARSGDVQKISLDRAVWPTMERTGATIGAAWVRETLGLDGSGVGVAIVDSGVTSWHDDLGYGDSSYSDWSWYYYGQRVTHFADFVNGYPDPYDDYGHGTHVAGIIAGNGANSNGERAGVAPKANVIALKVLDGEGQGYISTVIAAIDYAITYRDYFNIRVLNVSVAAGVYESYKTDPLTLAAKRAVEAGIIVVAAAGNFGDNAAGAPQYGGVTAPGNAPWVLTVGASSHMGTPERGDDTLADFSSRGPSRFDYAAKPDVVAPGVGIESLSEPGGLLYLLRPSSWVWGSTPTWQPPYFSLSGTSMAAPVVSGTIALMLQANPSLTPNAVKAILHYTAETRAGYNHLTQGAGFLNARGAVELASALGGSTPAPIDSSAWNKHLIWGNHRIRGGAPQANANAWATDIVWGAALTPNGENIVWGTACGAGDPNCDNIVWGTSCDAADPSCENIVWGTGAESDHENIVWGTDCGGGDCENIVWGTVCAVGECENIVWGTAEPGDNIVWGTGEAENIAWGTKCDLADLSCNNIVWGTSEDDTIVWGTRRGARRGPAGKRAQGK